MKSWPLTDAQHWTFRRGPQTRGNLSVDRRRPVATPRGDFVLSGRKERRAAINLGARLQALGLPPTTVTIANISNHGARVISRRPCQPHEQIILTEVFGDSRVDAEVIYCQRVDGDQYAVGLRFAIAIEQPEVPAARV